MNAPARPPGRDPLEVDQARPAPTPDGAPTRTPAAVEPPSPRDLVARAVTRWREVLVEQAGSSALHDIDLLGEACLDVTAAHPSGLAQLFAGRTTTLSNLVREPAALSTARRRARAVTARSREFAQQLGVAPAYLAIGVATWTEPLPGPDGSTDDVAALAEVTVARRPGGAPEPTIDGESADDAAVTGPGEAPGDPSQSRQVRAPVLLRPVAITPRGSGGRDYELTLDASLEINPVVARALRSRGALLDPVALARSAFTAGGFDPRPVLERLRSLGLAVLPGFDLTERVLVGPFLHPGQVLVDDLDALAPLLDQHEVVTALAGDEDTRAALTAPLPEPVAGDRDPALERGVGDLDQAQRHVLDVLAAGHHLFVDAPIGADAAGTIAAIVTDAAAAGRSVLYVSGHRRAAEAVRSRLEALGLGDLLLDVAPEAGWRTGVARRLLSGVTPNPVEVDHDRIETVRAQLIAHRDRLAGYITALHRPREPWGVSGYDAFQALARLTSTSPGPRTRVRLPAAVARELDAERLRELGADLTRAAELGAFRLRPTDTHWFDADLITRKQADDALDRVTRLLEDRLPALTSRVTEVAEETGLVPAVTVADWGEQLEMLSGVRGALDVFQPMIFERSAADMVAATAPRAWRAERDITMGRLMRRRLRKQAKDLVRPGRVVPDLHAALVEVQTQREIWQAHCPAGGWPRVPEGLATITAEYRAVREDLDALEPVLAPTPGGGGLADLPLAVLTERLRRLAADADALRTLPERTSLLRSLHRSGLGELLADLAERRVDAALVAAELDLAWWSAVFEQILASDPALVEADSTRLTELAHAYRRLDKEYLAFRAVAARAAVVHALDGAMRAHPGQAEALFGELVEGRFTGLRDACTRFPDVAGRIRPVLVAAPMLIPQLLPAERSMDLVVLDAAGHLPVEHVVAALARGRQVVVVGDTRCATGSALPELAGVLPTAALQADSAARDPYLTAFLAAHGYAGVLRPTPLPSERDLVRFDVVDGTGMPTPGETGVGSTAAEVEHVVELVIEHALTRPEESLAVVTPSPVHAERVREAVHAQLRDNPALERFADDGPEPFAVVDLGGLAGLSREAVIFSVGFGKTPHGRVLHQFGRLAETGGEAVLLGALGVCRRRLTVVSCFTADELDPHRLRGPGPRLLADLLAFAEARGAGLSWSPPEPAAAESEEADTDTAREPDRLVLDLADRLWRAGFHVEVDVGVGDGMRLPMAVGHPDVPGELLVAVLTDDEDYVAEPSVRVRDRLAVERLERLGWSVVQVWSAAAFVDPQAEADAIGRAVLAVVDRRVPRPVPAVPPVAEGVPPPRPPAAGARSTPRPPVPRARPIAEYTDDQLDALTRWLLSDGRSRSAEDLAAELRTELGLVRRGLRVDSAVGAAVDRALRTEETVAQQSSAAAQGQQRAAQQVPARRVATTSSDPIIPTRSADDSDVGWHDDAADDDERLRREVPPHW